jgi:predicted transcriptional regulator
MKNLWNLLFELSSEERTRILLALNDEKLKLTGIAERMNFTATEASRQLQRLGEAKLVLKDADGLYSITKYGELCLTLLGSLEFTSSNRDYFQSHDASVLPNKFISRLGDLQGCSYQGDLISTLAYDEEMFKAADRYVWSMSDQFHYSAPPIVAEKLRQGVDIKTILPENVIPPPGFKPAEGVERRLLPRVDFHLVVTDKEANFGLVYLDGRIDYAQFVSKRERFRGWCHDLFQHYWEEAKPHIGPFPNL